MPDAPDNHNSASGVSTVVSPPVFTNTPHQRGEGCPADEHDKESPLAIAIAIAIDTKGDWTINLQHDVNGSTGTMTIPQGGMVVTSDWAPCTATVAPDEAVTVTGAFVPATAGDAPQLTFSGVRIPIAITGDATNCPGTVNEATFTASYAVANTTDPNQQISIEP